jgi:hypothetical protein
MKKLIPLLLLIITLISCNKEQSKPVIYIIPTITNENNKWVVNLQYSDTINTQGVVKFYWVIKDNNGKSYKYFGSQPLENPTIKQKYNSAIDAFNPYTIDSLILQPIDYLNKYTILIK